MDDASDTSGLRVVVSTLASAIAVTILATGCTRSGSEPALTAQTEESRRKGQEATMSMTVASDAFAAGAAIPTEYTGDGADLSPPLLWSGVPQGTVEFAVICDDPDAPTPEPWVHWVIYKIPGDVTSLPRGMPPSPQVSAPVTALQGQNSWTGGRTIGYRGPAPPPGHGVHHYHFKVYAIDAHLDATARLDKQALLEAMQGHVLAIGELVGTYER